MPAAYEPKEIRVEMQTAEIPLDPLREINSSAFLKAFLGGSPATERAFRYLVRHLQVKVGSGLEWRGSGWGKWA
ncbi:MAG: hypothetical protein ABIW76_02595 [Fibrobacteria bacterium]